MIYLDMGNTQNVIKKSEIYFVFPGDLLTLLVAWAWNMRVSIGFKIVKLKILDLKGQLEHSWQRIFTFWRFDWMDSVFELD